MNTMKRLKSKYDSVNKAMGVGREAKPATESKKDKAWRTAREPLEKKERAVHAATTPQGLKAAIKAMDAAQKALTKVYQVHEKGKR